MTSPNGGSEVIKVDARGHMRILPQRREELLDEFDRSGMSTPDSGCAKQGKRNPKHLSTGIAWS